MHKPERWLTLYYLVISTSRPSSDIQILPNLCKQKNNSITWVSIVRSSRIYLKAMDSSAWSEFIGQQMTIVHTRMRKGYMHFSELITAIHQTGLSKN